MQERLKHWKCSSLPSSPILVCEICKSSRLDPLLKAPARAAAPSGSAAFSSSRSTFRVLLLATTSARLCMLDAVSPQSLRSK